MKELEKIIIDAFSLNDEVPASFIIRDHVVKLVRQGVLREDLILLLEEYYYKFEEEGKELAADYLLAIMDSLAGFTNSDNLI